MEIGERIAMTAASIKSKENCWYCKKQKKISKGFKSRITFISIRKILDAVDSESGLPWKRKYSRLEPEAHHLIPISSMAMVEELHKYIKKSSKISGDIGYDINHPNNGLWLPGKKGLTEYSESIIGIIRVAKSQIHNSSHPDYRTNVMEILSELHDKINNDDKPEYCRICRRKLKNTKQPPYGLVARLDWISRKMKRFLTGNPRRWKLDEGYYTFSIPLKSKVKVWLYNNDK